MRRFPPFTTDAVATERPPATAVIALGANLGDRAATLASAVEELGRLPLTGDVRASTPVESVARTADGLDDAAPRYLNAVATVSTRLDPGVLLSFLHAIEQRHGRVRAESRDIRLAGSGDRTLDLDLVAYGDLEIASPGLTVPHPRAGERDFVLAPWLSLDPDAVLPGRGRVVDLLAALAETGGAPQDGGPGASGVGA